METTSIWFNTLRDKTGKKVANEGMPILLDLYEKYNVKSTFYFTGYIAQKFPETVKMILGRGHEVGSHGYSHEVDEAFDVLHLDKQIEHLKLSKKILEDLGGEEVSSFRAPALRVNSDTPVALKEAGFKIDCSVPSQRFDMFLSFGGIKKLKWLVAPRKPYLAKENNLAKKGKGPIIEVPLSALFFPYVSTTMRIFPWLTKLQRNFIHFESKNTGKPVVFDIHPNEFVDESDEERIIERRAKNIISFVLADLVRAKLKMKNIGLPGAKLYENEIQFYHKRGYDFITVHKYCKENGFEI